MGFAAVHRFEGFSQSPVGLLLSIALKPLESKSGRLAAVHRFEGFRVKVR